MSSNVTRKTIDMRSLCQGVDPHMYSTPEPSYEFTGRKFTKTAPYAGISTPVVDPGEQDTILLYPETTQYPATDLYPRG